MLVGRRTSRRVCDDCASMLIPPEDLDRPAGAAGVAAPRAGAGARGDGLPSWERLSAYAQAAAAARTTASTTVAVAPRGRVPPAVVAVYLALAALALAAAGIAWLMLSSGPR